MRSGKFFEKYDLSAMLEEIREDEQADRSPKKELAQDAIRKMMMNRLKEKRKKG